MKMKLFLPICFALACVLSAVESNAQNQLVKDDGTVVVYGANVRGLNLIKPDVKATSNYDAIAYLRTQLTAKNIAIPSGAFSVFFVVETAGNISTVNIDDVNNVLDANTKNAVIEILYTLPTWTPASKTNTAVASIVTLNNVKL